MSAVLSLRTLAATVAIVAILVAWTLSGREGNIGRVWPSGVQTASTIQVVEKDEAAPPVWEILWLLGYAAILFAVVFLLPA
jgi:hypothetical protein